MLPDAEAEEAADGATAAVAEPESAPFCRICHQPDGRSRLVQPCLCRGTQSRVHSACIGRWVAMRSRARGGALQSSCEVCRAPLAVVVEYLHPARFLSLSRVAHLVYIGVVGRRILSELLLILRLIRGIRIAGRVSRHRVRILLLAIVRGLQYGACLGLDLRYLAHDYRDWAVASRRVYVQNRVTVAPQ